LGIHQVVIVTGLTDFHRPATYGRVTPPRRFGT
jgi:hypothetical protein